MTTTKCFAWVHFARAPSELYLGTATDGTVKELVSQAAGASLGDVAGQVVSGIEVQVGDGSIATYLQITGSDGGQVIQLKGNERTTGSTHANMNICGTGLSIMVERGMTLNLLTTD